MKIWEELFHIDKILFLVFNQPHSSRFPPCQKEKKKKHRGVCDNYLEPSEPL